MSVTVVDCCDEPPFLSLRHTMNTARSVQIGVIFLKLGGTQVSYCAKTTWIFLAIDKMNLFSGRFSGF